MYFEIVFVLCVTLGQRMVQDCGLTAGNFWIWICWSAQVHLCGVFMFLLCLYGFPLGPLFSLYSLKTCVLGESKLAGGVNGLSLCDGVASCPGCTSLFIKVSWDRLALCLLFGWTDLFALIVKWSVCTNWRQLNSVVPNLFPFLDLLSY